MILWLGTDLFAGTVGLFNLNIYLIISVTIYFTVQCCASVILRAASSQSRWTSSTHRTAQSKIYTNLILKFCPFLVGAHRVAGQRLTSRHVAHGLRALACVEYVEYCRSSSSPRSEDERALSLTTRFWLGLQGGGYNRRWCLINCVESGIYLVGPSRCQHPFRQLLATLLIFDCF